MGKRIVARAALLAVVCVSVGPIEAAVWNTGDVFVSANGSYEVYSNSGAFKETIADGLGGLTTGCAFNPAMDKLYTTNFSDSKVVVFNNADPHGILQTIDTTLQGGGSNESVVFAPTGDFYIGNASGDKKIQRYNFAATFLQKFTVATEVMGSDWIDLAGDQRTIFYTSEGVRILRFDVVSNTQLSDFAANIGGVTAYNLRLLPPFDGSGGLIVADTANIKRLNGAGAVVQTYDVGGEDNWHQVRLDPNGTSFWALDFASSNFYRFNLTTGAVEVGPINTGTSANTAFGLCVKGEPRPGCPHHSVHGHISTIPPGNHVSFTQHHGQHGHTVALSCPPHLPGHIPGVLPEPEEGAVFTAAGEGDVLTLFGSASGTWLGEPEVRVGGAAAPVLWNGLAPGASDVWRIDAMIPPGAPRGEAVHVTVSYGGVEVRSVDVSLGPAAR